MWKTVQYSQPQSASSQRRTQARRANGSSAPSAEPAVDAAPSTSRVQRVVKDLRRTAAAMPQSPDASLSTVLFPQVLAFLDRAKACIEATPVTPTAAPPTGSDEGPSLTHSSTPPCTIPTPRLQVIGLGIGAFERQESRSGFIQMAALVALKQLCHVHWRPRDTSRPAWCVETRFYEPLATPLHKACCQKLGVTVETTNQFGRYRPASAVDFVILFMPHCPWVLLHNTFATNWPAASDASLGAADTLPMQRVLWVANDLRETPLVPASTLTPLANASRQRQSRKTLQLCVYNPTLLSCLDVTSVVAPRARSKRAKRGRVRETDVDAHATSEADAAIANDEQDLDVDIETGGLSAHDVHDAFSELAVMVVKPSLSAEALASALLKTSAKPPPILEVTMEL